MADHQQFIQTTRNWVEQFVVGLQLCPFASPASQQGLIRYQVSEADSLESVLSDFLSELERLYNTPPTKVETTLLIHPNILRDFDAYIGFIELGEELIYEAGLEGEIQLASFHPEYRFADSTELDPANYSNRSPYPMLHLLREESVSQAVDSHPDPDSIPLRNIERLRKLGLEKVKRLREQCFP